MTRLVTLPHILLVLAGAFLIGVRAYGDAHPQAAEGDGDSAQLFKLAKFASVGVVLIMILVIIGLDFGMFRTAKVIQ